MLWFRLFNSDDVNNSHNNQRGGRICCIERNFLGQKLSGSLIGASEIATFKSVCYLGSTFQAKPSIRCFIKPTETLERSLEMNKHKGKRRVQKRPNYKNVGEEEDEEKGPAEDAQEDAEKAKGTEGGSKGTKTSGESEGECAHERRPDSQAVLCVWSPLCVSGCSCHSRHWCTSFYTASHWEAAVGRSGSRPALVGWVAWSKALSF